MFNIGTRVIFGLNRCNKLAARSPARVSSRSPPTKQFDRGFNTGRHIKEKSNLSTFQKASLAPSSKWWLLGGLAVGGLGWGASYAVNTTYGDSIRAIANGQDILTNIALINKLNLVFPNPEARVHYYSSSKFITSIINTLNQPNTDENRVAKIEALKLLMTLSNVRTIEEMIVRQLDLKQFIRDFIRDPTVNNTIAAPVALNDQYSWLNRVDKYVAATDESFSTIMHRLLNKFALNVKAQDAFIQSGYIPYLASLLKSNNNTERGIAIDTIARLTSSNEVRIELAKTDVFRTLTNYLFGNDELNTLRPDGKDETRTTILNAKFALRQLYLSATALYYLKTNNPDWEQWMTYTKHKSITSFNARDEQIAETIWQQSRGVFTAGALGLIWGTISKRLARPSRRHTQYFRKGGVPAAIGAMSLVGLYQVYMYLEREAIKAATVANDPVRYDISRLFTTILAVYATIGIPITPYALIPAFVSIENSSKWEEGYYRLVKKLQLL